MNKRQKILILENDDFLREIIGNILHKRGGYLLSSFSVAEGLHDAKGHIIDTIILGTSCPEYKGKETLAYIKKELDQHQIQFYLINHTQKKLDFIDADHQMKTANLSLETIFKSIPV